MLNFQFHNPTVIHFGKGQIKMLGEELEKRARCILVVTGQGSVKRNGIFDEVVKEIKRTGINFCELTGVKPNPRLESVYQGIELCRKKKIDFILAVGGGSVIDAAKAIAVGARYDGDVWDFFDKNVKPISALPVGTVLTLAATGSEMNSNSVITNEKTRSKLAMSSPVIRPVFSILDPAYTFTVDKYHTAAGVADILAHVFEYYASPISHTELQDALAEALINVCIQFGKRVLEEPSSYDARANIMWASTLALSGFIGRGKISDWTCHAIEHELSAFYDISHGVGLAILVPNFLSVCAKKYNSEKLAKYYIRKFFNALGLPSTLSEINITSEHFEKMADNVIKRRDRVEYFEQLSHEDILEVLRSSL